MEKTVELNYDNYVLLDILREYFRDDAARELGVDEHLIERIRDESVKRPRDGCVTIEVTVELPDGGWD